MRLHPGKGLATAGAIAAILMTAACSSSSSPAISAPAGSATSGGSASPSGAASATPTGAASGATGSTATGSAGTGSSGGSSSGAVAQIKANWQKFFASSTPTSQRVALLQNGSTFASAISSFASSPLASNVTSTVTSVTVTSSTEATVKYNLAAAGTTVQSNATGTSVFQDGTWKVGDSVFCGLLNEAGSLLGMTVPAACGSAG